MYPASRNSSRQKGVQTAAQPFRPELQDRHRRDHTHPRAYQLVRPGFARCLSPSGERSNSPRTPARSLNRVWVCLGKTCYFALN
jgi:hypothetical protein